MQNFDSLTAFFCKINNLKEFNMKQNINGITIEFEEEDRSFVEVLKKELNKKVKNIMDFFELTEVKDFKIKIWNNKDDYIKHLKYYLGNREYQPWMTADTFDGNINMLPLKYVHEVKNREDETEQDLAYDACHEFVHICQQHVSQTADEPWLWEMLATNLGNPENLSWVNSSNTNFNDIPNMKYLADNFDKINGYKYVFQMGQYLLKNKSHQEILGYVKDENKLKEHREELFEECKNFYVKNKNNSYNNVF